MILVFLEDLYYIQTQISDFDTISPSMIKYCKPSDIWFTKKRRKGVKIRLVARLNRIFNEIKKGIQKVLLDFQNILGKIKERVHQYIPNLKTPICRMIDGGELSEIEKTAYSKYSTYKGNLHHLFLFYNWNIVNEIEEKYSIQTRDYNLISILKAHIIMCKRRIRTYTDLIEEFHENERLADVCGFVPNKIPTRTIISRAADKFGIEIFREITIDIVKNCMSLGLMKGRFVGVDGTLIKSNTNPHKNKETKDYTDIEAGLYVHGNYIKGIGFLSFKLTDIEFGLPMLVLCYKGSANENPLLREIFTQFFETYGFYPSMLSADKGMDSSTNNDFCKEFGISAYIQTRNFGNKELIKTEKGKTFHPNYVEITDPRVLERIANRRTESERQFSNDKWGYRRDRMSNRGGNEAELYMLVTMITTLLTAITAFYVGRPDLIRSSSAFKWLTKEGK
jgi:hypothetical protein